jgi:uncharacterized membrane protein
MAEKPMFFFTGVYDDLAGAEADYATVKALHDADDMGSYDAAIVTKHADGRVRVTKSEKPAQHGAWIGLAAGAASAMVFPVLLPGLVASGAAGAGLGAWFGHLAHGTNREDAREAGALLDEGSAALILVGLEADGERLERLTGARRHTMKSVDGDFEEAEHEALAAMEQATS